jgi:hypothetical protein
MHEKVNKNVLPNLKTQPVYISISILILVLIIVLISFLFKGYNIDLVHTINPQTIISIFVSLFFVLLIFGICVIFLPTLKDIKTLFQQISSVTYVILYTIFLIFLFRLTPSTTLNEYSYIIVPLTILIGSYAFYKAFQPDYISEFTTNYERIKSIILMFCLITIYIIFYQVDPGGIISNYFGYTLLLTILIATFSFIYLIITITLPDDSTGASNLLSNFSKFSIYSGALFILFITLITFFLFYYPGGFFNDVATSTSIMILLLIISILWSILIISNTFPEIYNKSIDINKNSLLKRALLILFSIIISGLLIFWIVYNLQHLSGQSSIISFILNILLVLIFLAFIYKTVVVELPDKKLNSSKTNLINTIMNFVFYIPSLFSTSFDFIAKLFVNEYHAANFSSTLMLLVAIIIIIAYFTIPSVSNSITTQGGKQLLNNPVYAYEQYTLANYTQLNGSDNPNYQYAISFWLFIDAVAPNMNASYDKNTSILNYGDKPNVLYNGKTNTLIITINQKDLAKHENKLIDFDENNNRILYKNSNMLLQKWNNIIINYNGGILDVFLNGELVKSAMEVIPYFTLDNLTIGETNGIKGGICNVIYFNKSLTATNIHYLYNSFKDKNPPVTNK